MAARQVPSSLLSSLFGFFCNGRLAEYIDKPKGFVGSFARIACEYFRFVVVWLSVLFYSLKKRLVRFEREISLSVCNRAEQEAQLSRRNRAMLCII